MAGEKITDYSTEALALVSGDLFDVSKQTSPAVYESQKVDYATILSEISDAVDNIYTADGTLPGNRTISGAGYLLKIDNGNLEVNGKSKIESLLADVTVTTNTNNTTFEVTDKDGDSMMELLDNGGVKIGGFAGAGIPFADACFIGYHSFSSYTATSLVNGCNSVGIGAHTGQNQLDGVNNVYIGEFAGSNDQNADHNTYIGANAGAGTLGSLSQYNVAIGSNCLPLLTTADQCVYMGFGAGAKVTTGGLSVGIGAGAGSGVGVGGTGAGNVSIGAFAGNALTTGGLSVIIGHEAGKVLTTGGSNVLLGYKAGNALTTESNQLRVANNATQALIEGDFSAKTLTLNVNNLNLLNIPTGSGGLSAGDVWSNGGVLTIV